MFRNISLRTLKFVLPVLVLAVAVLFFSFKSQSTVDENNYYFEYSPQPPTMPSEADYETESNWNNLPSFDPQTSESPCPEGEAFVCVLKVSKDSIDIRSGSSLEEKLDEYLESKPSASTFVNNSQNYITRKPLAEQ